jgi:SAM-dependent methyltransferase
MSQQDSSTETRRRLYARYLSAGGGPPPYARPEDAPGGLRDMLRKVVREHFPPSREAAILDLGCGHGMLVHAARRAGYRNVAGVDASPEQVAFAERLGIGGIRAGDAFATLAALAPESHDAIVCFDVLEHLTREEMLAMIDGVYRALRPGGRWIIHSCNAESPFFGRVRFGDLTHEQAFTRVSLRQALLACGFAEIRCFEDAPVPGRPGGTARWIAWTMLRLFLVALLMAESGGDARRAILTQNLLAVAIKR